jgi:hypothetical protein
MEICKAKGNFGFSWIPKENSFHYNYRCLQFSSVQFYTGEISGYLVAAVLNFVTNNWCIDEKTPIPNFQWGLQ